MDAELELQSDCLRLSPSTAQTLCPSSALPHTTEMPADLSSLSPELRLMILQWLSLSKDLSSCTRASPLFHRVFNTCKESTLSAVLRRAISPNTETDFLLALRAQQVWKFQGGKPLTGLERVCTAILEQFRLQKGGGLCELASDSTHILALWNLYSAVESLMASFSARAYLNLRLLPQKTK